MWARFIKILQVLSLSPTLDGQTMACHSMAPLDHYSLATGKNLGYNKRLILQTKIVGPINLWTQLIRAGKYNSHAY